MIKTISINLSGQVFQIDENAYEQLKQYLEAVRNRFVKTEGNEEIIADIESRIAEMMAEKISDKKQSVTIADIDAIIAIMGRPEQFESEESVEQESTVTESSTEKNTTQKKRMFRDPDDKVLGGVCSGLSAYFGISDPLWLRVIMVIFLFLSFGTAFWIYVILWIIIPKAKTASDKLQMKGEPVNIDNIEKTIKEDFADLQHKIENINNDKGSSLRKITQSAVSFLGLLLKLAIKVLSKIFALFFIVVGIVIAILLVFGFVLPFGVLGVSFPDLFDLVFENSTQLFLGAAGVVLLTAIPAFGLIFSGIRTLIGSKTRYRIVNISLTGLWLVGLVLVFYVAASLGKSFSSEELVRQELVLQTTTDTLKLNVKEEIGSETNNATFSFGSTPFIIGKDENSISLEMNQLDIAKSNDQNFSISIRKKARGKNRGEAGKRAEAIEYNIIETDSSVIFPTHYSVAKKDKFRSQEVILTLNVPVGKVVFLSYEMEKVIYDVKNVTNTFDGDMVGHYWKMTEAGLMCLDCDFSSESNSTIPSEKVIQYDLQGYNSIKIDGNLNVEIKQGDSYSFEIRGKEEFAKNFNAQKEGNELRISSDFKWKNLLQKEKNGTVYITTPVLSKLVVNGLNATTINGFKTDKLNIEINGGSINKVNVEADDLTLVLNGAAGVEMKGKANKVKIESSGAAGIDAYSFEINNADIVLNGAADAKIFVIEKLKANLNGASKLQYRGNPKIQSNTSGGATIQKAE
jgi:phage shock protein PspC (stress-responsive transcriptional regulator)